MAVLMIVWSYLDVAAAGLFNNIDICQVGEARYIQHKKEAAFLWSAKGEMS